ncbi:YkvA family protein [Arthrobacter sp.]|uniref:YkvA family protein n=1 Tax=Arthrobacter sp. TaxID=1667 RepID=UPI003A8CEDCF
MWWQLMAGTVGGFLLLYLALLAALWVYARKHPDTVTFGDALRLLPDLLRLIRRMMADRAVPARVRFMLVLLLIYLVLPIDLVPDFLPVIGYADDVVIVALVLRSVIRHSGFPALERNWPGSPQGLDILARLSGADRR